MVKYARKLNYEDAYDDIMLYFIKLIKSINLDKLTGRTDKIIISYINKSIINFYHKKDSPNNFKTEKSSDVRTYGRTAILHRSKDSTGR